MQFVSGDNIGNLKIIDAQNGTLIKKWNNDDPLLYIKILNQIIFVFNKKQEIYALDLELSVLSVEVINICSKPILNFFLIKQEDLSISGVVGSITFNPSENIFQDQHLIYSQNNNLKAGNLKDDNLLLLWTGVPPSLFNLQLGKIVWQAKNVPNDYYDLQVKMDDNDGVFLDENTIVVLTQSGEFRFYDIKKNHSRPFEIYDLKNHLKSTLTKTLTMNRVLYDEDKKLFYIVTINGDVLVLDQRKSYQIVGKLKGSYGSLKSIHFSEDSQYIITSGIDRFIRFIFKINDFEEFMTRHNLGTVQNDVQFLTSSQETQLEEVEVVKQKWNVQNGEEARNRFKYMRKHSIKLNYLKQMFENQKILKKFQIKKDQKEKEQLEEKIQALAEERERALRQSEASKAQNENRAQNKYQKQPMRKKIKKNDRLTNKPRRI